MKLKREFIFSVLLIIQTVLLSARTNPNGSFLNIGIKNNTTTITRNLNTPSFPPKDTLFITVNIIPIDGGKIVSDTMKFNYDPVTGIGIGYFADNNGLKNFAAVANPGCKFSYWSYNENSDTVMYNGSPESSTFHPRKIVTAEKNHFYAHFNYIVTAVPNIQGAGTITGTYNFTAGSGDYPPGTNIILNATPALGYVFVNWTDGDVPISTDPSISLIVNRPRNLVANFKPFKYTILATPLPAAGGSTTGSGDYIPGTSVPLRAIPASGYDFVNWTESGVVVSSSAAYDFNATSNRTLVANFKIKTYLVSASVMPLPGGTISGTTPFGFDAASGNGSAVYNDGDNVTLTATPAIGYSFVNWTEGGVVVSNTAAYNFTAKGNRILVANFVISTYTITATTIPTGSGTITDGIVSPSPNFTKIYSYENNVTLTAAPITGYDFINWTEAGVVVSTSPAYSFPATGDRTLVANFKIKTFLVSASVLPLPGGTISGTAPFSFDAGSGDGTATYNYGDNVTLTALPATGYSFVNWTEGSVVVSNTAAYNVAVQGNRTLVANFVIRTYAITASVLPAGSGTITDGIVSPAPTFTKTYTHGDNVTLTAIPASGYDFVNWTEAGVVVSSSAAYNFNATSNRILVANFKIKTYLVSASVLPLPGGTISGTSPFTFDAIAENGSATYNDGDNVILTATPATGYNFVSWTEGGVVVSNTAAYNFIVQDNRMLVANFVLKTYTITASVYPAGSSTITNGTSSPAPSLTIIYSHGDNVTLTASPGSGYEFVSWTDGGVVVSGSATYSFTATGDQTLVANFKLKTYLVTASVLPLAGGNISGTTPFGFDAASGNGSAVYNDGDNVTLTAIASTGYSFVSWTEAGVVVSNTAAYNFIAKDNRTLVANFVIKTYTITASVMPAGSGTITDGVTSPAPNFTKIYSHGDNLTLTAAPAMAYDFVNWTESGVVVSSSAIYNITATGDRTLVANFKLKTYLVSASVLPLAGGSIAGTAPFSFDAASGKGSAIYNDGDNVTLTATPATGYIFVSWTQDGVIISADKNLNFYVSELRNLVANFIKENYVISASVLPVMGGLISANGASGRTSVTGVYTYGNPVNLIVTPATGYVFLNWTEAGIEVSTSAAYSFTATGNRTLVANLVKKQYTITATANPTDGGTIALTGTGTGANTFSGIFNDGDNVMLTATPIAGNEFVNWTENGVIISTNPNLIFTAASNRNLVANFRKAIYTITVTPNPPIGGTVMGGGMFEYNTDITVTATPANGYSFVNWSENGNEVSKDASYKFTATINRDLVANFKELQQYKITTIASPPEGGIITGNGSYFAGTTAKLTASPNKGYTFVNWTENGTSVSTDTLYSFTVTKDRTMTAVFQKKTYTLEGKANPPDGGIISSSSLALDGNPLVGNGTNTVSGTFTFGDIVKLTATPDPDLVKKYKFVSWTDDGNTVSTNSVYEFSISKNHHLLANFEKLNEYFIYTYIKPADGGSTVGGGGYYYSGSTAVLTCTPSTGYVFVNWIDDKGVVVSTSTTYSFLVTGDRTLTANLEPKGFTINAIASPTGGGTISGTTPFNFNGSTGTGTGDYKYNDKVKLTAVPSTGYDFVNWTENNVIINDAFGIPATEDYSFTVINDRDIVANFKAQEYQIEAIANPKLGGTIAETGNTVGTTTFVANYNYGDPVMITATPSPDYIFTGWSNEIGTPVIYAAAVYSFVAVGNRKLIANFKLKTFTIIARVLPLDGGTITGSGIYNSGGNVTLNAIAAAGYEFVNWTEDGTDLSISSPTYTFIAGKDRSFTANFLRKTYLIQATTNPTDWGNVTDGIETAASNFNKTYNHGVNITLIAATFPGYEFINWTEAGNEVVKTSTYSFTATQNRTLVANFKILSYTVKGSTSPKEGGIISGTAPFTFTPLNGTGTGDYNYSDNVKLTAIAATGYDFINWTEDGTVLNVATSDYAFIVVKSRNLKANFTRKTYLINATTTPPEGGTISDGVEANSSDFSKTYRYGDNISLTATTATGYEFINWTEAGVVVSGSAAYSFTATGDRTLVANFKLKTYLVSASIMPLAGGTISGTRPFTFNAVAGNGSAVYNHGDNVTLTTTPATGYSFVNWTEGGVVISNSNVYNFIAQGNRTLVANFALNTYAITANVVPAGSSTITDGITSPAPSLTVIYSHGDTVTLTASPGSGYEFVSWTNGGVVVSGSATYSFTTTGGQTLIANFIKKTYPIKAIANPTMGGTITDGVESAASSFNKTFTDGDNVKLTASAAIGYEFVNWTEDGMDLNVSTTEYAFIANKARDIKANFVKKNYLIKAATNPTEGGTLTDGIENGASSFSKTYRYSDLVKLTASVAIGYVFVNWTEDGTALNIKTSDYTFLADSDRTLKANFIRKTYLIKAISNPTDGGTVTDGVEIAASNFSKIFTDGDKVQLSANAAPCFDFVSWTEGNTIVSLNANYSFQAKANRNLTANFKGPATIKIIASDSVCTSVVLNFKLTSDKTATNILWDFGDGSTATGTETTHVFTAMGQFKVTATALMTPLCNASAFKIITVNGNLLSLNLKDTMGCSPFHLSLTPITKEKLLWNFGDDNNWYSKGEKVYVNATGRPIRRTVTIVSENSQGCNATSSFAVTINPSPKSAIEAYTIPGRPEILVLKNKSIFSDSCDWELADGTHQFNKDSVIQQFRDNGIYRILLKSSNQYGCVDTTSLTHRTLFAGLFVPNAFRPESTDQKVNTFKPIGLGLKYYYMGIYDLWGNLIWQTTDEKNPEILEGWDGRSKNGTPLPVGVYIWRIKAIFLDGTEWKGSPDGRGTYRTEGNVTLLR
jgi:hypothetical protein